MFLFWGVILNNILTVIVQTHPTILLSCELFIRNTTFSNRELLHEIETLRYRQLEQYDSESEASEREWLKDEKERLEVKQEILESHNRQLEYQLQRLRLLIGQVKLVQKSMCSDTFLYRAFVAEQKVPHIRTVRVKVHSHVTFTPKLSSWQWCWSS